MISIEQQENNKPSLNSQPLPQQQTASNAIVASKNNTVISGSSQNKFAHVPPGCATMRKAEEAVRHLQNLDLQLSSNRTND